jgi:hypothetical protein
MADSGLDADQAARQSRQSVARIALAFDCRERGGGVPLNKHLHAGWKLGKRAPINPNLSWHRLCHIITEWNDYCCGYSTLDWDAGNSERSRWKLLLRSGSNAQGRGPS